MEFVDSIAPYLEWQSGNYSLSYNNIAFHGPRSWVTDSAYKKDPPADYYYPPHDPFAKLSSIKANLQSNLYSNEYEFQKDLYQVFALGHDGHFVLYPDLLTKALEWGRARALVSISKDGTAIPEIYIYGTLIDMPSQCSITKLITEDITSSPSTASPVSEINGMDASKYVMDFAATASFNQDADAAYNTMFFEKAFVAGGVGNGYFSRNGRVRYM